jgi:hypothetical protein
VLKALADGRAGTNRRLYRDDSPFVGTPFYVMDRLEGRCSDASLPGFRRPTGGDVFRNSGAPPSFTTSTRRRWSLSTARRGELFQRQIGRWTKGIIRRAGAICRTWSG